MAKQEVEGICVAPVDVATHVFVVPRKEVKLPDDIEHKWLKSEAYRDLLDFIRAVNEAVKSKKLTDPCHTSQTTENLLVLLETLGRWVDEIPPIEQPQRFGNTAFRDWFKRLEEDHGSTPMSDYSSEDNNADSLLRDALDEKFHRAIPEISVYLCESVGNSTRIDYGTGHEMAFVAFLSCLFRIGACVAEDAVAIVCKVFASYIEVMRKVQLRYRLEPAGSQGSWNLDDYQFIPFMWGSAQLIDHPRLKPTAILSEDMCASFAKDYMYFGCIQFIHKVKTGPFAEHSNQLYNISGVPLWAKVNQGLIKMYCAEVLPKFPIIQHFLFGSLLRINPVER